MRGVWHSPRHSRGVRIPAGGPRQDDTIWGIPVVVTSLIGAGTALLGDFANSAQLFRRGGLSVEASNSPSDYFRRNLAGPSCARRWAVYRPSAIVRIDGLN